jgi:hypothetical protein
MGGVHCVQVYIREQAWGDAHQIARSYGLDTDMVYRARWAARPVDVANIQDTLAKMADRWAWFSFLGYREERGKVGKECSCA